MLSELLAQTRRSLSRFLQNGIDDSTPAHLIDRIVYSNWICAIGTLINLMGAQANFFEKYDFLLTWNGVYEVALIALWLLNRSKYYLAGRVIFLSTLILGICVSSAAVGRGIQMEHFLLATAALSFTMFHPSERRWAWFFGGISALAFFYIANQPGPILNLPFEPWHYRVEDLRTNQYCYVLLCIFSLIALSNAYARAIRVANEQQARLFETSKMAALGQMAGNMAHEINNPIAIIQALGAKLALLAKAGKLSEEEALLTLRQLDQTSSRIAKIVNGMRSFSRDGSKDPFEESYLNPIIEETVALCQERYSFHRTRLELSLANSNPKLQCRAVQISQVLLNLLNNALDATSSQNDRWVRLSALDHETHVTLVIQDSGRTIAPALQEKLFQPFFTTKAAGTGTGLGLAISRAIVQEHGGTLRLDTANPTTTFIIDLPKLHAQREKAPQGILSLASSENVH